MKEKYTTVRGPGFSMTSKETTESNLEQLALAVRIRHETPKTLHIYYTKLRTEEIAKLFNHYLFEVKEKRGISCEQSAKTGGLREFIHTYVKQTEYARLKTEEQLLML